MKHRIPEWYRNAKLGIMVHWGVPTIPAYAPVEHGGLADILRDYDWRFYFRNNPYAEWYLNSLRIADSPVRAYHRKHYGDHTKYERLARRFTEELGSWDPHAWADLFREAGARYVVMVAKHHDGYLMWPSSTPPVSDAFAASRDVVGELGRAVREQDMRYGVYYSSQLDWTVQHRAIRDFSDLLLADSPAAYADSGGAGEAAAARADYARYAEAHLTELVERYRPDVLWNDIGLPSAISRRRLFRAYREAVPHGVLNDRWRQTGPLARRMLSLRPVQRLVAGAARRAILDGRPSGGTGDVATLEYPPAVRLAREPWELVRGLGKSFCYNAAEPDESYLSGEELVHLLADVVSKNGNLLLNVAPRADGVVPPEQRAPLADLAAWLRDHAEAIYGTRPWHRAEGTTRDGIEVRYTTKSDRLYAILLGRPRMLSIVFEGLDLRKVPRPKGSDGSERFSVRVLGCERPVQASYEGERVVVDLPGAYVPSVAPVVEFAWTRPDAPASRFYTDII